MKTELLLPPAEVVSASQDPSPTAACLNSRREQLHRFLVRRGFSDFVAERAVDRVVRAALRYLKSDATVPPLRNRVSWLFGCALRAARQEAAREPACVSLDPTVLASMVAVQPDNTICAIVWAAVEQLTDQQQQAVYLCVMRGLSLAEAGREMGCATSNVLGHRDRGLDRLRTILPGLLSE